MKEHIRLQLDACRPGEADWLAEDMDSLREWMELSGANRGTASIAEQDDLAIRAALLDAEVPVGLADQIRQSIAHADASNAGASGAVDTAGLAACFDSTGALTEQEHARVAQLMQGSAGEAETAVKDQVQPRSTMSRSESLAESGSAPSTAPQQSPVQKQRRRRILPAVFGGATAAVLLLGVFAAIQFWGQCSLISGEDLGRAVASWDPNLAVDDWRQDLADAPGRYPVCDRLNVHAVQWKPFATPYDKSSVVYDMTPSGTGQIYLYAIRSRDRFDLPAAFAQNPLYSVRGFSVGACQRDGIVYVLLVEGDVNRYRKVIKGVSEVV